MRLAVGDPQKLAETSSKLEFQILDSMASVSKISHQEVNYEEVNYEEAKYGSTHSVLTFTE